MQAGSWFILHIIYYSLDDSPLLDQRYKNPMYFVQCCNFAMCFLQPFNCPHSPWSWNVAPYTLKVYNVANAQYISYKNMANGDNENVVWNT